MRCRRTFVYLFYLKNGILVLCDKVGGVIHMRYEFDAEFYKRVLNQINSNIYITDVETDEIVYINDYMKRTFQLENAEGETCWKILQKGMKKRCDFCRVPHLEKDGGICVWREKNTVTGRIYLNHDSLEYWNGRWYHVQNAIDITDRLQLSMEASIDELTGILNRNAGKKLLDDLLKGMKEADKFTISLYDINGLKWVNDTYGHLEGDRLLVFVAQNIQKELGESDFVFRLSGDEFIIVFADKNLEEAEEWMKNIQGLLEGRRAVNRITYDVTFSYGLACIYEGEHLSVSDVLSIADAQMYIQKRDYHILIGKQRLHQEQTRKEVLPSFQYNKDYLFEALSDGIDDYVFVGNLKTGEFMYSYKMVVDFGLPGQVVSNAAAFWGEKIHPDDEMMFLRSNQEIADGRAERHTIAYRAKNAEGDWVHLLCKGKMIRDPKGQPDLFAGVIRNLDNLGKGNEREFQLSRKDVSGQGRMEKLIDAQLREEYLEKPEEYWWEKMHDTSQKEAELRIVKEQYMKELLSEELVFTFRLNMNTDKLEEVWVYEKGTSLEHLKQNCYEALYESLAESIAHQDDRKQFLANYSFEKIREYVDQEREIPDFEFRQKQKEGEILWVSLSLKVVRISDRGEQILFGYACDIDLQKKRELSLQKKAEMDEISGFYNDETLKLLVGDTLKKQNMGANALLILDVDDFKEANHEGNFLIGDAVLRQMADEIRKLLPPSCIAGRQSGDVFIIFFSNMPSGQKVYELAESIRKGLCRRYQVDQYEIPLSVSAGIAYQTLEHTTYKQLYQDASQALETVKQDGKDRLAAYQSEVFQAIPQMNTVSRKVPFEQREDGTELNFYQSLENCMLALEQGSSRYTVYMWLLEYIGKWYGAQGVLLFFRNLSEKIGLAAAWRADGMEEATSEDLGEFLEETLKKNRDHTAVFIHGKQRISSFQTGEDYDTDPSEPMLLMGIYENDVLKGGRILKNVHKNTENQKLLLLSADFLRRTWNMGNLQKQYEYLCSHDKKTGVKNYDAYVNYVEHINEDVLSTFGMISLQVIGLKKYNQKYGIAKGTELLIYAADLLRELFGSDSCYRISGANFLVLCPDISYENFAERYGKLEERLEMERPGRFASVRAWECSSISVAKMQQQVEEKIQVAVNKKRNSNISVDNHTLSDLLKGVEDSIEQGNFRTFLQPKADAKTGRICGAEALVRYYREDIGIISPAKFLPAIEKAGMIRHVDLFVLKDVCRIMRGWLDRGWNPFTISLNYSRATILEPGILEETNRIVESWGIPKQLIEIEVTESIGSIDSAGLKNIVNNFVEAGYKIALDDFGAEYSNIYVLYSLNITSLKLDRRIVSDIYHNSRARMVVENVIGLCRSLGIRCVAEGVETKEHLEILRDMSCDMVQGYYLNKPLSEEDFLKLYIF